MIKHKTGNSSISSDSLNAVIVIENIYFEDSLNDTNKSSCRSNMKGRTCCRRTLNRFRKRSYGTIIFKASP